MSNYNKLHLIDIAYSEPKPISKLNEHQRICNPKIKEYIYKGIRYIKKN
jgi:hypothetical protein